MSDAAFVERQQVIRRELLAVLYEARRQRKVAYVRQLIHTLGFAPEECRFALDVLAEADHIRVTGVECRITAQGIKQYEQETQ